MARFKVELVLDDDGEHLDLGRLGVVEDGLVDRDVRQVLLVLGFSISPFQYR